jgi:hypothetical protein
VCVRRRRRRVYFIVFLMCVRVFVVCVFVVDLVVRSTHATTSTSTRTHDDVVFMYVCRRPLRRRRRHGVYVCR